MLSINDFNSSSRYGSLVYRSPRGDTIAWLRNRRSPNLTRSPRFAGVSLYSRTANDAIVMTTFARRDLLDPPDWHVQYHTKSSLVDLITAHRGQIADVAHAAGPRVFSVDEVLLELDRIHSQFVELQIDRGVY